MVVRTKILPPGAIACTFYPWIFCHPDYAESPRVLVHESVHLDQQRRWAVYGLGVGLLVWHLLYLLALPVGWNWWRARWETEAMAAEGVPRHIARETLRSKPYYLWWA